MIRQEAEELARVRAEHAAQLKLEIESLRQTEEARLEAEEQDARLPIEPFRWVRRGVSASRAAVDLALGGSDGSPCWLDWATAAGATSPGAMCAVCSSAGASF